MAWTFPLVNLVVNVASVAVLWLGASRIDSGHLQIGSLVAYLSYLIQILMAVMLATFTISMVPRAAVSAGRIQEVIDTDSTVVAPAHPSPMTPGAVAISFRGVSFHYPGAEHSVLDDISFDTAPGETTAIVGSTGAGKTTLLQLIPRLFDVTGGSVRLGGTDVRELDTKDLWSRIGLVPQRPYLFSGTIASNLRDGLPAATEAADVGGAGDRAGGGLRHGACPADSRPTSNRAAPTSPEASGSASRSRAPWCAGRTSTCSTTRSPRST